MSKTIDVTVGKHDSSVSYLTTSDFRILEYPSALLPNDIKTGTILKITIASNEKLEKEKNDEFLSFQNNLLKNLSSYNTKPPVLKIKSKLQTSINLFWGKFDLGVASLKNITLWHKSLETDSNSSESITSNQENENVDEEELSQVATIYNTVSNTYKMSGLNIESKHAFQLRIDTSNGLYKSDVVVASTLSSKDFSGFNICIGALSTGKVNTDDIRAVADALGIVHVNRVCNQDTTHFLTDVADDENEVSDEHLLMAKELNIPIVTPNWLQGCLKENKLLGVKGFYYKLKEDDPSNLVEKYPFQKDFTDKFLSKDDEVVEKEDETKISPQSHEVVNEDEIPVENKEKEESVKVLAEEKHNEDEVSIENKEDESANNLSDEKEADAEEDHTATIVKEQIPPSVALNENTDTNTDLEKENLAEKNLAEPIDTTETEEPANTENIPEITETLNNDEITPSFSAETPSSVSLTPVSTTQSKKNKGKKKKNNKKKK